MTTESQAPPPPTGYLPVTDWRYWEVLVAFFSGAFGSLFVASVVVASGADPSSPLPFSMIFGAQAAFSLGAVWFLSRSRGSGSLAADVGFVVNPSDWWGVFAGMGLQIAIVLLTAPIIVLFWPDGPPTQGVAEIAAEAETLAEQLAVFVAVASSRRSFFGECSCRSCARASACGPPSSFPLRYFRGYICSIPTQLRSFLVSFYSG